MQISSRRQINLRHLPRCWDLTLTFFSQVYHSCQYRLVGQTVHSLWFDEISSEVDFSVVSRSGAKVPECSTEACCKTLLKCFQSSRLSDDLQRILKIVDSNRSIILWNSKEIFKRLILNLEEIPVQIQIEENWRLDGRLSGRGACRDVCISWGYLKSTAAWDFYIHIEKCYIDASAPTQFTGRAICYEK